MGINIRLYSHNIWNQISFNRNELIKKLIYKYDADICNFQECGPATCRHGENAIHKIISERYAEACIKFSEVNFTPVFYKSERFEEIDSGYVLFEGKNDADSKSITWVVLHDKVSKKKSAVASTHFWWEFASPEDDIQRIENARCVKKVCDQITKKYDLPVIVSGDFNCGMNSDQGLDGYNEMIKLGFIDLRYNAESTTDCFTHHDYPVLNSKNIFEKGNMPVRTLDHAFAFNADRIKFRKFDVLTEQDALDSSDHCPLLIDYDI